METNKDKRKQIPIYTGVLKYFPNAIAEVAKCSYAGNKQHHPDKPLHWDRSKSTDELDALTRHLMEAGQTDTDGIRHSAKVAWRALANLQKEIENENIVEKMYTVEDTAEVLRVSIPQIYKLRRDGKIFFKKNTAGKVVCLESELKRFIDNG